MQKTAYSYLLLLLFLPLAGCAAETGGDTTPTVDGDAEIENASDGDWDGEMDGDADGDGDSLGAPLDLIPYARLRASETFSELFPWPREDKVAIATIRDDQNETVYRPPVDTQARVSIDLAPWLGGPVRLDELRLSVQGQADIEVTAHAGCVDLFGASDDSPGALFRADWPDGSATLSLDGVRAACVVLSIRAGAGFALSDIELISREQGLAYPEQTPDFNDVPAAPPYPDSGVIEGFYGVPWSWRERRQIISAMAAKGLGSYLYAPKLDALHRELWRDPYPQSFNDAFAALAAHARALGVRLIFGISPFIDYDFDSPSDYETLKQKCAAFLALGADGIAVLGDDIEFDLDTPVDGALGARHAEVVNTLSRDLRADAQESAVWFVPTAYSDQRADDFTDGVGYLEALRTLDQHIEIMWTGPDTSNATMSAEDMQRVTDLTGRKPLIWENYWANDGGDGFTGKLLLEPFAGRTADLVGAVSGIAHNPMIQGALSRLVLTSFSDYMADPGAADLDSQIEACIQAEEPFGYGVADRADTARALGFQMALWQGYAKHDPAFAEMEAALYRLEAKLDGGVFDVRAEMLPLIRLFARMAAVESELHHAGLDADMLDELIFPAQRIRYEGELGLWSLALLSARLNGENGEAWQSAAEEAWTQANRCRFVTSNARVRDFFERVKALSPAERGGPAFAVAVESWPPCATEQKWWPALSSDWRVDSLWGLPGAHDAAATGGWQPPYADAFKAALIAVRGGDGPGDFEAWSFDVRAFACTIP